MSTCKSVPSTMPEIAVLGYLGRSCGLRNRRRFVFIVQRAQLTGQLPAGHQHKGSPTGGVGENAAPDQPYRHRQLAIAEEYQQRIPGAVTAANRVRCVPAEDNYRSRN
jgi:hypothetical protein